MRLPLALLIVLLLVPRDAAAWSPGPYPFDRCVTEFDIAVRGQVIKVETVGRRTGGWILSRAHLAVERAYYGTAKDPKTLSFYFWSQTDNYLTLKHELAAKQRILVFLSSNLDPLKGITLDGKTTLMLQFAKANHRGYLYTITRDAKRTDMVNDAIFHQDPSLVRTLASAEAALAKK